MKKAIALLSVLLVGITVPTIWAIARPIKRSRSTPSELALTEKFRRSLAFIQQKQIAAFKDLDWCKTFEYQKGRFTNNNIQRCTYDFNQKKKFTNFNSQAQSDFEQVKQALSLPKVETLEVKFERSGKIESARFGVFAGDVDPICKVVWSCNRKTYIYQPNYGRLPGGSDRELWYEKVNQDWYVEWQDWN